MNELLAQFLVNFGPALTVLVGFLGVALGILSKLKDILSKSNVDNVLENIKAEKETFHEDFEQLKELANQLLAENAELRNRNMELLEKITRVKQE